MPRKKTAPVEAGDHLGLLHKIVFEMYTIPPHLKDEAVSEGMVLLTQAAQSFDPERGYPIAKWLSWKLYGGLLNWQKAELKKHTSEPLEDQDVGYTFEDVHMARMELELLVNMASEVLDDEEYTAIFGPAFGLHMKELSHLLKANPAQIKRLQDTGRNRIQEMRML